MNETARKTTPQETERVKGVESLLRTGRQKIEELRKKPIWSRTKKELEATAKAIGEGTERAAKKTVNLGKRAGLQYQIYMHSHKLQRSLAELGGRIYDLAKTNSPSLNLNDPQAWAAIKKAQEMDEKILGLKEKTMALKRS